MIHVADKLYDEMERELNLVSLSEDREATKARLSFEIVDRYVYRLKELIVEHEFRDAEEEIKFFKVIKPRFQHLQLYFGELAFIAGARPIGDRKLVTSYLRKVIQRNSEFIERHKILHIYYLLGHTCEDEKWFVRNPHQTLIYPASSADFDPAFSTQCSSLLSKLLAFEKVNDLLGKEIQQLKKGLASPVEASVKKKDRLLWTDSKAALVELAYALLARGSANYGKADVNQIVQTLEIAFNIQTGNYYRTFTDLSNRKKGRTPFLDSLKEHLERRMDDRL